MSEMEKKDINEMDAAEMLERHREQHRERETERPRTTENWTQELIREFRDDSQRWHRRQGWDAFVLCLVAGLTVVSCCAALVLGEWKAIVAGIAAANLLLAGGWWHKAWEEWRA